MLGWINAPLEDVGILKEVGGGSSSFCPSLMSGRAHCRRFSAVAMPLSTIREQHIIQMYVQSYCLQVYMCIFPMMQRQ